MKIELVKIPVKIGETTEQKDYVNITINEYVLSLPLDPSYDSEEYKKIFEGFFKKINDSITEKSEEATKENNE